MEGVNGLLPSDKEPGEVLADFKRGIVKDELGENLPEIMPTSSIGNDANEGKESPKTYKLQANFKKYGDQFRLFKEDENGFIYERKSSSGRIYYEVFKKRVRNVPHTLQEDVNSKYFECEVMEIYPGDEDFGKWAWFCTSKGRAYVRFESLKRF